MPGQKTGFRAYNIFRSPRLREASRSWRSFLHWAAIASDFPREVIYLILLIVQLWMAVPMSPVWRGGAFNTMLDFTKVLPIVVVMALVVNTIKKLRWLILVQAGSVATIAAATIWKGHQLGGRLEGALGGIYGNANDLAFAIAISAPLCLYFLFRSRSKLGKTIWALAILVMVYAVFLTASRAGLISLVAATATCLWEFAIRGRRRYLLVVAVVAGVAFWVFAGNGVGSRFDATAQTTDAEQASAYVSAQQRWDLLAQSLKERQTSSVRRWTRQLSSRLWFLARDSQFLHADEF